MRVVPWHRQVFDGVEVEVDDGDAPDRPMTGYARGFAMIFFLYGCDGFPADEVQTPALNDLVDNGIELERNYVHMYCSPSRSSLPPSAPLPSPPPLPPSGVMPRSEKRVTD